MSRIEESIDVDVPVRVAYDQWTQFESFPSFMDGVESITQTDPTHNHWVTKGRWRHARVRYRGHRATPGRAGRLEERRW